MKCPLSWATAVLAALLQLHCGGAVSLKRKQPKATGSIVRVLRAALGSRTEELTQQKNIAHGLELEVRELQSELQAEKKALSTESQKEQSLQQKLNRVRAVLDDGPSVTTNSKKADKGLTMPAADRPAPPPVSPPMSVPMSDDDVATKTGTRNGQLLPPLEVSLNTPALQEGLESLGSAPDSELESSDPFDGDSPARSKPLPVTRQSSPQAPSTFDESALAAVHARQMTAQEPPFFEAAAAIQSSSVVTIAPAKHVAPAKHAAVKVPKKLQSHSYRAPNVAPTHHSPPATPPRPVEATRPLPSPLLRGSEPIAKAVATPRRQQRQQPAPAAPDAPEVLVNFAKLAPALSGGALPAAAPRTSNEASTVASTKDSDTMDSDAAPTKDSDKAAPTSASGDFDALEAQLHEEDRRIQDLDKENALDDMTNGAAPGASAAPSKTSAAQPKMDLESEAPMEDFLNVEAPGPDSGNEAAPARSGSAAASNDASLSDDALALPQMGSGLDGALSDNQFLAQIAPGPRQHG